MNDNTLLNYYWLLIILMIPLFIWIRYSTSLGKSSQKALAHKVNSLQKETASPLFVCLYENEGPGILLLETDGIRFFNATEEVLKFKKDEITTIEYSEFGFCHVVTANKRYKFAYIHHAKDAKSIFTMVFGPAWRDDEAIRVYGSTLAQVELPHNKVEHPKLVFLPQIKM